MIIKKLDYERFKGQKYQAEILSDRYLFMIRWKKVLTSGGF